eukprot:116215_1
MSVFILLAMVDMIRIATSKTSHCNYAVDLWWLEANPPSLSPTPAPTNSPSRSPTSAPTFLNEILTTKEEDDMGYAEIASTSSSGTAFTLLLNPYPIDTCYAMDFMNEPFNAVSLKYTCNSAQNTLTRTIYWDSLQCDGDQVETTEITASERGQVTTFVCNADANCPIASVEIQSAMTQNPTPEPSNSPTTAAPTDSPVSNDDGNDDDDDGEDSISISISDNDSDNCADSLGPDPDSEPMFAWKYAQNICIDWSDLKYLFEETSSPTSAPTVPQPTPAPNIHEDDDTEIIIIHEGSVSESNPIQSLGWVCKDNRYAMTMYDDTDCEGDVIAEGVVYKNDLCVFDDSHWAYVECEPTNAPTEAAVCETDEDCDTDGLCVTGSGVCRSKIVSNGCTTDSECDDGYKCNQDNAFCYFSECEQDGDCDDYESQAEVSYTCSVLDGINGDDNAYSYGVCIVDP